MKKNILFKFSLSQFSRIKKNFNSLFLNFSVQITIQIFYLPLMLFFWGTENFGIWIFVTTIPSTLSVLNIDFTRAAKTEMSINNIRNKKKEVNQNFQNAFGLTLMNMLIFSIISIIFFLLKGLNLKIFESIELHDLKIILFFIFFSFYFILFDSLLATGISYRGKLYIQQNIKTIFDALIKIAVVISGFFFNNLIYAAGIFFLMTILKTLFFYYYFTINKKYLVLSLKFINLKNSLKLFKLSLSYYLEAMSYMLKNNGLIILLGIFFTAELVGLVSAARTLFYFLPLRILGIITNTSIYEYSQSYAKKQMKIIKYNFNRHIFLTICLILLMSISLLATGPTIFNLWTHNEYNLNYLLILLLVTDCLICSLRNTLIILIKAVNKFLKAIAVEAIISILIFFITYYFLTLNYNYLSMFIMNLIGTLISFIAIGYFSFKFYGKLK